MNSAEKEIPAFFTQEMRFVWLIRSDVRDALLQGAPTVEEAQRNFCAWWILYAPSEYHNLPSPPLIVCDIALESEGMISDLPYSRLLRSLRAALSENVDAESFLRWVTLDALPRLKIQSFLGQQFINLVQEMHPEMIQDAELPLTRLMVWVHAAREDLQKKYDLETAEGRQGLLAWYYVEGICQFESKGLLGQAEVAALMVPLERVPRDPLVPISRLTYFWFIHHHGVNATINWADFEVRRDIRDRAQLALETQGVIGRFQSVLNSEKWPSERFRSLPDTGRPVAPEILKRRPFGVNLVGYGMGELGIGEDVRMMARCLEEAGVSFCIINRLTACHRQEDFSAIRYFSSEPLFRFTVISMTGFDTATFQLERPDVFETSHVIGFWPWEIPVWPAAWNDVFKLVDEVWASSHYTGQAFEASSAVPVKWMPMAVTLDRIAEMRRKDFGLPEESYLFLFVFDFQSYVTRKNPLATLEAFQLAFPNGDENVRLVLKVSNVNREAPAWKNLSEILRAEPRILLIDRNLKRDEVPALMRVCDAYLSLHRAEGFGRTLAEAMLMERAVVATNFSGNVDFLNEETGYPVPCRLVPVPDGEYPFAEGSYWAEPDVAAAAHILNQLFAHPEEGRKKALKGKALILSRHGALPVGEMVRNRLIELDASMA